MTISNIALKATGPSVTKFHIERPWADGRKNCSYSQGHMTNIAPCLFVVKTFKTSSLEPVDRLP